MRELAIGDIHGCARSFETLLKIVQPRRSDTIILLGDYIDRGPESCRVIDMIIELNQRCTVVALMGNHEIMLRHAVRDRATMGEWLRHGGRTTLQSYERAQRRPLAEFDAIPESHWRFYKEQILDYWETEERIFVHASVDPEKDMDAQSEVTLFWQPFADRMKHKSGKQIICGHTAQRSGLPVIFEGGICIDTCAYGGGWLTCLNTLEGVAIQANERGAHRMLKVQEPTRGGERNAMG